MGHMMIMQTLCLLFVGGLGVDIYRRVAYHHMRLDKSIYIFTAYLIYYIIWHDFHGFNHFLNILSGFVLGPWLEACWIDYRRRPRKKKWRKAASKLGKRLAARIKAAVPKGTTPLPA